MGLLLAPRQRMPYRVLRRGTLPAVLLVVLAALPARALHKESPPTYRITDGVSHPHPQTRSWGNYLAFAAAGDLTGTGDTRQQIYFFNLAFFDCFQGTTLATTPCPNPVVPFLVQVTYGRGNPDNPAFALPFATDGTLTRIGSGNPANSPDYACEPTSAGKPCTVTHWFAFDAQGDFLGSTGPAATHRQIFLKNLATGEIRQVTFGVDGDSTRPQLNSHGGLVTFESTAHLLPTSTSAGMSQVYVYQTSEHLLRQITFGGGPSTSPIANSTGDLIAFESTANLLGNGADTGTSQIFWSQYDKLNHTSTLHQLTRGNGPSRHPYISEVNSFILFDSSATDLLGTVGTSGTSIFMSTPLNATRPQPPALSQLTVPDRFGDCSYPMADPGSEGDHVGFICTGDPLQNGTTGNRVFVLERSSLTLMQITGKGDVQPPIGGTLGSWFVTMSTTDNFGGQSDCGYQLWVVDYLGTMQCCHDPKYIPATQIGQLPPDVASPGGDAGSTESTTLIGKRVFAILPGDATGGSQGSTTTSAGTSTVGLQVMQGEAVIPLVIGGASESTHQASIKVPASHVALPPVVDGPGGAFTACLKASADGEGVIDCDGFDPGGDLRITQYHNADSSLGQSVDVRGTFAAGGMRLTIPVTVTFSADAGVDGRWCTPDDTPATADSVSTTLRLGTGSVEVDIADADGVTGSTLTASDTGSPFNCAALQAGVMAGAELVGGVPLIGVLERSGVQDVIVGLHLQPMADQACRQSCSTDADCDDGNACNGVETCVNGFCHAGTPVDCNDGDPCTIDSCDATTGTCTHALCDDGNPCNGVETCDQTNGCQPGTPIVCSDGDACNGEETCDPATGACQPGTPPTCDDGNPCTDDSCVSPTGCVHVNNDANTCDDGNACTTGDACVSGVCTGTLVPCDDRNACNGFESCDPATGACLGGAPPVCDDGNPCTDDSCDPLQGCLYTNNTKPCDDGSACTTGDVCTAGVCTGTPLPCDDGNPCNGRETCDPLSGTCVAGVAPVCDDGNPCTDDSCDPHQGCVSSPNTAPCDDGNLCTTGDTCSGGVCVGTPVICDDGDLCNGVDVCDQTTGTCVPGTAPDCDDGNPCTVDACDPATGVCTHTPAPDALVCLSNGLAAQLAAADPAALGGQARKDKLTTRLRKVQAKLADAVRRPGRARRDYTRAFRGLLKLQRALQRGIVRQNFDVPLANQLIGSTAALMGEVVTARDSA